MFKDIDIIYFTLFPWDHPYSSVSLSFTREFAKNNRVFYINHPFTIKDFISNYQQPKVQERKKDLLRHRMRYEQIPGFPEHVIAVHPPNTLPINWLDNINIYDRLYHFNNQIILKTIKKVIDDYQLDQFLYLNCFNPFYAGVLPKSFGAKLNVYQCIDDMTQEAYTAKHAHRLEEEAIRQADVVLVTSSNLKKLKAPLNAATHIVHNAVDTNIFSKATEINFPKPPEIAHVKNKIIGFTGNLNEYRVDYKLLRKIALHHQDKTLLLVGPLNSNDYKDYGLDQLPNVILTGGKDIRELPQYLQHMDCAIIPFLCNKLTSSVYPLKINEYLAAGKAVVSTNFSEDIRSFKDHILLADDHDHFLKLIDLAVAKNDPTEIQQRIQVAQSNSWKERVKQFWTILEQHHISNFKPIQHTNELYQ